MCSRGKGGNTRLGRDGTGGREGGSASVKGVGWSSMQAFPRSCSVTRVTVDFFFCSFFSLLIL